MTTKLQTSTLRPGLLVSIKTSMRGNVSYQTEDRGVQTLKDGTEKTVWETTRQIADPAEHEAAQAARTKARNFVSSICAHSAFGMLCPEDSADELEKAIAAGHKIVAEFNGGAKLERVNFYILVGRIAQDDVEAVKAINSEVRELLGDMTEGLKNLDPQAVRKAAAQLRSVGQMLSPEAQIRAQFAIDAAREAATKIKAAGEAVAVEIDTYAIRRITEQRTAFLDIEAEVTPVAAPKPSLRQLDPAMAERNDAIETESERKAYNAENRKRARKLDMRNEAYYRAGEE